MSQRCRACTAVTSQSVSPSLYKDVHGRGLSLPGSSNGFQDLVDHPSAGYSPLRASHGRTRASLLQLWCALSSTLVWPYASASVVLHCMANRIRCRLVRDQTHTDPHTPLMRSRGARHIRLTQCARTHCWTTTNWHHAVVGWETGLPTRAHRAHAQRHSHRHASERADERASERARRKQEQQQQHLSSAVLRQHTPQFGFRVACGGDARARREGAATKCYPPSSSSSLGSSSSADTMATEHDTLNLSGNPFVLKLLSSFSAGNETVRRAR